MFPHAAVKLEEYKEAKVSTGESAFTQTIHGDGVISLEDILFALNSVLRSSKSTLATAQDDPPNLRRALAQEARSAEAGVENENTEGRLAGFDDRTSYVGPQHTAPDAERVQQDAERAAWAENTSWVVEHAKWDADCEIMGAEMVRGEEEQARRARGLCQVRLVFRGEATSTGCASTATASSVSTGIGLPLSPTRAALFAEIKHLTANADSSTEAAKKVP
ncbi:hypothetical protein C8J57DRAFT_1529998 [Mycena rebaudengoi]|nr:hypothetical protein C8J57DRAFT_1529998 [Mycena rebaudengoi]